MRKSHHHVRVLASPGEVFARRVRDVRTRRGLSQQAVVDRLRALGVEKVDQTIVSKIESRARRVTLEDALALALALDVSPVSLFLPHGEDERVRLTPGRVVDSATAWEWATEREPLPDMHAETFYAERSETAQMTEARAALVQRLAHETGDE